MSLAPLYLLLIWEHPTEDFFNKLCMWSNLDQICMTSNTNPHEVNYIETRINKRALTRIGFQRSNNISISSSHLCSHFRANGNYCPRSLNHVCFYNWKQTGYFRINQLSSQDDIEMSARFPFERQYYYVYRKVLSECYPPIIQLRMHRMHYGRVNYG